MSLIYLALSNSPKVTKVPYKKSKDIKMHNIKQLDD